MDRTVRALLPYGVVTAQYLLAASALYGGVLLLRPEPSAQPCVECHLGASWFLALVLICGALVLPVGLLVGLVMLTVRLRRARRAKELPQSASAIAGMASRAAVTGFVWGLVTLPVLCCGALGLFRLRS